ncbi:MAG: PAS domain-containing protein [Methylococcaceae bacterium]
MNTDSSISDAFSSVNCSPEKLLHDLQMRHIELEVQNEHLRNVKNKHEESDAYYADLFNNAPIGYLVLSDKGLISDVNIAATKLFGIERRDLLASSFASLVTVQHSAQWSLFCRELKKHKQQRTIILSLKGCGNTEVSVGLDCLPINSTLRIMLNEVTTTKPLIPDAASTELFLTARVESENILNVELTKLQNITNEALEQSHQYLKFAISSGKVGIWQYNLQTHELIWDDGMLALYDCNRKDFSGVYNDWYDRLHPDDRAVTEAALQDAISGKSHYTPDFRVIWANGEVHHLKGHAHVVTDKAGIPQCMIGTNWDNSAFALTYQQLLLAHTAINNSKEAIQDAAQYARSLLEASLDPLVTISSEGKISDVNGATERVTGLDRQQLIGSDFADYFTDAKKAREGYQLVFSNGFVTDYPLAIKHVSGKVTEVIYNASVYRDDKGCVLGVFAAARDITERKQIEHALRESEFLWKFAIEGSGDGVWDWNILTDQAVYSRLWKEMLGYSQDDILPTNHEWLDRIHPDDQRHVAETLQAYLDGKTTIYVVEYRLRCKDKSYKWILSRGMVVDYTEEGTPLRMIGTHTDISKRKHQEQQDKEHLNQLAHVTRLGLMGEMASGIAHEVNQPLTAIATYTQASLNLMKAESPNLEKLAEIVYKTQQQALRAGQIIRRMREFVKSNTKQVAATDLNELIQDAAGLCLPELKLGNITLTLQLQSPLPLINVDRIQIEQVIINLIRNSADAFDSCLENQQKEISIDSLLTLNEGIEVRVKDNGPGIPDDQQQQILMPFYTTKTEGMGMGLSICCSIIEAHEGHLHFNSEVGKGTTFYFTLPIKKIATEECASMTLS